MTMWTHVQACHHVGHFARRDDAVVWAGNNARHIRAHGHGAGFWFTLFS
jgi:hypothetical protein